MQYIASLSYGKDSLYMLEIIKRYNLPLDRIIHLEIMATSTIPADLPEMIEFKQKADKIIKDKYNIEVEHIHSSKSYEDYFYKIVQGKNSKHYGEIYGFPYRKGAWCNSRLKTSVLNKFNKKDIIQYIGIGYNEKHRYHNLNDRKISPLVLYKVTEEECFEWCKQNDLLSPIYENTSRGGCWFCHNQPKSELKNLRKNYPEYWNLMLKWDKDSPNTFKQNGTTIRDFDKMFEIEDRQLSFLKHI